MNYWLMLTNEDNFKIIVKNNIYASKKEKPFHNLKIGDKIVLYFLKHYFEIIRITKKDYDLIKRKLET